jgi:hypothetical protein
LHDSIVRKKALIENHTGAILVVTGGLTLLAGVTIVAPSAVLGALFGSEEPDIVTRAMARHWGLLVALVGGLLLYAGYDPALRTPVMLAAAVEKLGLGAIFGFSLPRRPLLLAVIGADAVMAILYLVILALTRGSAAGSP